jgi:hypothetical protein
MNMERARMKMEVRSKDEDESEEILIRQRETEFNRPPGVKVDGDTLVYEIEDDCSLFDNHNWDAI